MFNHKKENNSLITEIDDTQRKIKELELKSNQHLNNYQREQLKIYQNALMKPLKYMGILINTIG